MLKRLLLIFVGIMIAISVNSCKVTKVVHIEKGLKKGWTKNSHNPHHHNSTNPGHNKSSKGKSNNGKGQDKGHDKGKKK